MAYARPDFSCKHADSREANRDLRTPQGCCRPEQLTADTKRTHQKRHARRLATHPRGMTRPDLQKKLGVASDRACTRVTLRNLHGKECHEEGPPAEQCSARPRETKGGPLQCCTPDWISVASVSTSTCSTARVRQSNVAPLRRMLMDCAA